MAWMAMTATEEKEATRISRMRRAVSLPTSSKVGRKDYWISYGAVESVLFGQLDSWNMVVEGSTISTKS